MHKRELYLPSADNKTLHLTVPQDVNTRECMVTGKAR